MSYDLNILILEQMKPIELPFKTSIELTNEINDDCTKRYINTWKFLSNTRGIWYSLVKEDCGVRDAFLICDSDFEKDESQIAMPYWINDEQITYNLTPLIIRNEFINEFERILRYLLEQSPIKTLILLARYQGGDTEIICGVLMIDDFLQLLNNGKILFNTSYIISSK